MTTEGEYHSAGSSQREGGSSGAASRAAAGAHARSDAIPAFLRYAFRGAGPYVSQGLKINSRDQVWLYSLEKRKFAKVSIFELAPQA